jgi:hypothetical protein
MQVYIFNVTGSGQFPLDMLRYDSCYPATQTDVTKITDSIVDYRALGTRTVKVICRASRKGWEPAAVRWASFGWTVSGVERHTI